MTLRFWQIVKAKSKTMGCWVRSRPLLPTSRMVSFSCSIIDYKSLTYAWGFAAYNRFPYKNSFSSQSDDRQKLIFRRLLHVYPSCFSPGSSNVCRLRMRIFKTRRKRGRPETEASSQPGLGPVPYLSRATRTTWT